MAGLRIAELTKEFATARNRMRAVSDFRLEVGDGELMAILGPSGSGKTTLLRLIAGLEKRDCGEIMLGSESITHRKPEERRIGMAFQYPALLPQLTVAENIGLGPKLRGASAAECAERTRELAEILAITELLTRQPQTLSGGQQQRVSLARALATRPELLLLDEPLANLDPTSRIQLRESIRAVQQQLRVTTLYVTHDQEEAAAIADRIGILRSGCLQQTGGAAEIYNEPANLFVAQFFAPEPPNIIPGEIASRTFQANGGNLTFPINTDYSGTATCILRPRSVEPGGQICSTVLEVKHTGWSCRMTVNASGVMLRGELPSSTSAKIGEPFSFAIDPAGLLFFDSSGGRLGNRV